MAARLAHRYGRPREQLSERTNKPPKVRPFCDRGSASEIADSHEHQWNEFRPVITEFASS